ncbi:TetR/AcrR family transcriptional regulator [Skermanella stibiiresistens]|uniref:TetR/AcrR family transcriptional regulator n=1 Tax=Skermanella stibiiresistens TaxID=913326 RepID=UPI0004B531ED|nr:TetR/AcrR family transcriptional regulator [Skermanella stibiiresistens]
MAKKADLSRQIVDAAMKLAGQKGWRATTMADIAAEAKLSLADIYRTFPGKSDILRGFTRQIDELVLSEGGQDDGTETLRDRVFDVMMRRFDALTPYRAAVDAVSRDLRGDPVAAAIHACALRRSLAWMLEAAGVPADGLVGAVRVKGLGVIYLAVMRVWLTDDSADLSRTMAALDARLRQAEQFSRTLRSRGRRGDQTGTDEDSTSGSDPLPGTPV